MSVWLDQSLCCCAVVLCCLEKVFEIVWSIPAVLKLSAPVSSAYYDNKCKAVKRWKGKECSRNKTALEYKPAQCNTILAFIGHGTCCNCIGPDLSFDGLKSKTVLSIIKSEQVADQKCHYCNETSSTSTKHQFSTTQ